MIKKVIAGKNFKAGKHTVYMNWKENKLGLISLLTGFVSLGYLLFTVLGARISSLGYNEPPVFFLFHICMFLLLPLISLLSAIVARSKKEQPACWKIGFVASVLDLLLFLYVAERFLYYLAY